MGTPTNKGRAVPDRWSINVEKAAAVAQCTLIFHHRVIMKMISD
jgi:hypothetical protein